MTADRLDPEAVFHAARHLPPDERAAYLDRACAGDPAARARLDRLLAAQAEVGSFLDASAPELDATRDLPVVAERAGTVIGPYKLLEQIGEGGFGVVFLAEQTQPVRRTVALKVVKPGMDTRQVIARFEAERQALAVMDHPNIARVLDAGETATGRPYFVMELVRGMPITDHCDRARLPPRERLELFVPVCRAVQHAHQKGIIHRDLKPSNVLVSAQDGRSAVKVIDFGIAKATGGRLTDKTLVTGFAQLVGTPAYMSPEQAAQGPDVDTRSDVYSLGVLLYELLTGTTPFPKERLRAAARDEVLRIIREEDPPKPSARLSESKDVLPSVSARRHTEPAQLTRLVRGDLDWIVMKALEKDRGRRYETAAGFAADVESYLADRPVQAGPPSFAYRFTKFARRNKVLLGVAGAVATVLAVAVVTLVAGAVRLADQERATSLALDNERAALGRESAALDKERAANDGLTRALSRHRVALARREWLASNVAGAEQLLADCPVELRHWEWHYLRRLCRAGTSVLTDRLYPAGGMAVSPNGTRLAFRHQDGTVRIADTATGKDVSVLEPLTVGRTRLMFSPDGARLIGTGATGLHVWDAVRGVLFPHPLGAIGRVECLAQSPDGVRLAAGLTGGLVRVLEAASGKELRVMRLDRNESPSAIDFSPDGRRVAVTLWARDVVRVLDVETAKEVLRVAGGGPVAFAQVPGRDGAVLAAAGTDRSEVLVWDAATGQRVWSLRGHTGAVADLTFSRDGRHLATAGADQLVQIWDATTGRLEHTYRGHSRGIHQVRFGPGDAPWLASAGGDGTVRVWGPTASQEASVHRFGDLAVPSDAGFTPDGQCLAVVGRGREEVRVVDLATGLEVLVRPSANPQRARLGPGGRHLAWMAPDRTLVVGEVPGGRPIGTFAKELGGFSLLLLSPGGRYLSAVGTDQVFRVWEVNGGRTIVSRPSPRPTMWTFSRDGRRVAAALDAGSELVVWDLETGRDVQSLRGGPGRTGAWLSPDGGRLAWAEQNTIHVTDVATGREEFVLRGHHDPVHELAYTPDGRRAASGGANGEIRLWDLESGHEVLTLKAHLQDAGRLEFSPDGHRLVSVSRDRTVKIWDATPLGAPAAGAAHPGPPVGR